MDAEKIYRLHELMRGRRTVLTMADMAEHLQCSERTVKRAIRDMRDFLHAPIAFDREFGGYRYSNERYELPGLWFSAEEMLALLSLQQRLAELGPGLLDRQLAPLKTRIEQLLEAKHLGAGETTRIRLLSLAARQPDSAMFQVIAGALLQRKRLEIHYHARGDDNESERIVSPQRLVHYRDNWHLDVWCHAREALRNFALDRIMEARVLDTPAVDIADTQLDTYFADGYGIFAGEARHTAILRFTPQRARWVADETWHPRQQGRWLETGEYELRIPYVDPRELVMDILRHVPEVEVIAPEELRQDLRKRLEDALKQHLSRLNNEELL